MVGWLHRLNGHEFEERLGVGDGQGGLASCGSGVKARQALRSGAGVGGRGWEGGAGQGVVIWGFSPQRGERQFT